MLFSGIGFGDSLAIYSLYLIAMLGQQCLLTIAFFCVQVECSVMFQSRANTSFIAHSNYISCVVVHPASAVMMLAYTTTLIIYAVV